MDNSYHVWYAEHEKYGELILAVRARKNEDRAFIYAPKIIAERLRHCWKKEYATELSLGPLGLIPAHLYQEAGIMTTITPSMLKLLKLPDKKLTEEVDQTVERWMLMEWNKQVV